MIQKITSALEEEMPNTVGSLKHIGRGLKGLTDKFTSRGRRTEEYTNFDGEIIEQNTQSNEDVPEEPPVDNRVDVLREYSPKPKICTGIQYTQRNGDLLVQICETLKKSAVILEDGTLKIENTKTSLVISFGDFLIIRGGRVSSVKGDVFISDYNLIVDIPEIDISEIGASQEEQPQQGQEEQPQQGQEEQPQQGQEEQPQQDSQDFSVASILYKGIKQAPRVFKQSGKNFLKKAPGAIQNGAKEVASIVAVQKGAELINSKIGPKISKEEFSRLYRYACFKNKKEFALPLAIPIAAKVVAKKLATLSFKKIASTAGKEIVKGAIIDKGIKAIKKVAFSNTLLGEDRVSEISKGVHNNPIQNTKELYPYLYEEHSHRYGDETQKMLAETMYKKDKIKMPAYFDNPESKKYVSKIIKSTV